MKNQNLYLYYCLTQYGNQFQWGPQCETTLACQDYRIPQKW